jgi:hypothetical protein
MNKVDEKSINELQQNVDKFADKFISDDFKVDKEQSVKLNKFFNSFVDIINKYNNLLSDKGKKVFNNIFLNLDKIENKKFSDNTVEQVKTYLKKHDYESIGDLLEKDISLLGGKKNKSKRNKSKRNKSKRNKSKRNKSKRNKSKRNKSKRNKSRRNKNSKYSKLKGGMVNEDEIKENDCSICLESLNDNTRGQSVTLHSFNGVPHRYHFNCIKDWVLTRINENSRVTCPLCKEIINFDELPDELYNDLDIQEAFLTHPLQAEAVPWVNPYADMANDVDEDNAEEIAIRVREREDEEERQMPENILGGLWCVILFGAFVMIVQSLINSLSNNVNLTQEQIEVIYFIIAQLMAALVILD